jgi:hypothetical protein
MSDKKNDKPRVRELKQAKLPKAKADKMVTVWECVIHEGETLTTTDHRRVTLCTSIVIEVHNDWLEAVD